MVQDHMFLFFIHLMFGTCGLWHRLAGATLLAPVINYWWPSFPANLSKEAYYQQFRQDQWTLRVVHYTPWLTYLWNTQMWFPASSVAEHSIDVLSLQDRELIPKLSNRSEYMVFIFFQENFLHMSLSFMTLLAYQKKKKIIHDTV